MKFLTPPTAFLLSCTGSGAYYCLVAMPSVSESPNPCDDLGVKKILLSICGIAFL